MVRALKLAYVVAEGYDSSHHMLGSSEYQLQLLLNWKKEVMFLVALVCLFVCSQHYFTSFQWTAMIV